MTSNDPQARAFKVLGTIIAFIACGLGMAAIGEHMGEKNQKERDQAEIGKLRLNHIMAIEEERRLKRYAEEELRKCKEQRNESQHTL